MGCVWVVSFQNLSIPGRKYHSFPDRQKKSRIRLIAKKNPNFAQNFLVEFLPACQGELEEKISGLNFATFYFGPSVFFIGRALPPVPGFLLSIIRNPFSAFVLESF
jgi:hypothetical protein